MSDLQNNVRFSWQLVSQFVSWEFCRYMCEQRENNAPETDVLTFLRNMIVQRTEKSMSEITKHEIVAKFIMETKEVQHISRMSCITPLSEAVKKIFPELAPSVSKLVHYLETFLNVLDSTDEGRRELIHQRIDDAINDFLKEANRLLPQPHLLQIIDSWSAQRDHIYPKPVKKVIYNAMLCEKVLECLHFESITPSEALMIAVSLNEDKVFEKILLNAEAEPETEADSEQFSLSVQSSHPNENIYSQEFAKSVQAFNAEEIPLNWDPPPAEPPDLPDSLQLGNSPPVLSKENHNVPGISEFNPNKQPPHLIHLTPAISNSPESPPAYPFIHRVIPEQNEPAISRNNETHNHMQFAQSSANESPSDECNSTLEGTVAKKFKQFYINQRNNKDSDSDTSDCDKNAEIRFLTPTLFKKSKKKKAPPQSQVVYLSDSESNDSSVVTITTNSQQIDPNWTSQNSIETLLKNKKSKKPVPPKKKIVRQLESDSSDDNHDANNNLPTSTSRLQASTPATHSDSGHLTKRRREEKNAKLYRSPNISIQDFVSQMRRPTPAVSNEIPVHVSTNTRPLRKRPVARQSSSTKRQKCKQCSKAFKTVIALRRHVFLKHTNPLADSDCDA